MHAACEIGIEPNTLVALAELAWFSRPMTTEGYLLPRVCRPADSSFAPDGNVSEVSAGRPILASTRQGMSGRWTTGRISTVCFGDSEEALSTRCVGQGVVVSYGMANRGGHARVRAPKIGPVRALDERLTRVASCGMK